MRRLFIAGGAALILSSACTGGQPQPVPTTTSPGRQTSLGLQQPVDRAVEIYAAIVRRLVTVDHTYGEDPHFRVIFIINGPVQKAADPMATLEQLSPSMPFSEATQQGLANELSDLPPLEFIDQRDWAIAGKPPGHVVRHGVLLTLGPIPDGEDGVEVGANLWVNGLAALWLTYALEERSGEWNVVETHPMAIA